MINLTAEIKGNTTFITMLSSIKWYYSFRNHTIYFIESLILGTGAGKIVYFVFNTVLRIMMTGSRVKCILSIRRHSRTTRIALRCLLVPETIFFVLKTSIFNFLWRWSSQVLPSSWTGNVRVSYLTARKTETVPTKETILPPMSLSHLILHFSVWQEMIRLLHFFDWFLPSICHKFHRNSFSTFFCCRGFWQRQMYTLIVPWVMPFSTFSIINVILFCIPNLSFNCRQQEWKQWSEQESEREDIVRGAVASLDLSRRVLKESKECWENLNNFFCDVLTSGEKSWDVLSTIFKKMKNLLVLLFLWNPLAVEKFFIHFL